MAASGAAQGGLRCFGYDRQGATALEFAILAVPFMAFFLFIFEIGVDFYVQEALDYGLVLAARNVQTGAAADNTSVVDANTFKQAYLCPAIQGMLNCAQISINVLPLTSGTDYYSIGSATLPLTNGQVDTRGYQYNAGQPDQLMLVQALYTAPSLVGQLVPSWSRQVYGGNGSWVRATLSSIGFINERRN